MMGSFISRVLILVLGYAYPAYECYKTLELNKPEIEKLRFCCQYWVLVALLAGLEIFGNIFFSWFPLYSEAKLGFYLYLWYPKTRGAEYIYETYFRPYIEKHETEIDRNLLEFRARAADMALISWQTAASYFQTSFSDVFNYVKVMMQRRKISSFQQTQRPQEQQQAPHRFQQPQQEISTPPDSIKRLPQEHPTKAAISPPPVQPQELVPEAESSEDPSEEPMQVEVSSSEAVQYSNPESEETPMEEALRVTRNSLRKQAAAAVGPVQLFGLSNCFCYKCMLSFAFSIKNLLVKDCEMFV